MNKTKITWLLIGIIIAIVAIIVIKPFNNAEAPIVSNVPKEEPNYDKIPHTFVKDDLETDSVSIHVTKPIISGLASEVVNNAVNSEIDNTFSNIKKSFLADTDGVEIFSKEMKHQLTVNGSAPLSSSKKVFYVDTEIYSYFSGAAHPLTQRAVLNFVKETGQLIRLEDILKRDKPTGTNDTNAVASDADFRTALDAISEMAKPKILEQMKKMVGDNGGEGSGADSFEESGADPKLENYSVFYIHEDKIEWVFGQYQVAPYVFGEIKISISMKDLTPYLATRSYLK